MSVTPTKAANGFQTRKQAMNPSSTIVETWDDIYAMDEKDAVQAIVIRIAADSDNTLPDCVAWMDGKSLYVRFIMSRRLSKAARLWLAMARSHEPPTPVRETRIPAKGNPAGRKYRTRASQLRERQDFALRLKRAAHLSGLIQSQLLELMGISQGTLTNLRSARIRHIKPHYWQALENLEKSCPIAIAETPANASL